MLLYDQTFYREMCLMTCQTGMPNWPEYCDFFLENLVKILFNNDLQCDALSSNQKVAGLRLTGSNQACIS